MTRSRVSLAEPVLSPLSFSRIHYPGILVTHVSFVFVLCSSLREVAVLIKSKES